MKNSFLRLFRSHQKPVPEPVQNELYKHFPNAINVDWELKKTGYEAIFYVDEVEHIAQLSEKGELIEFKKNLWPGQLPEEVNEKCREQGEIMNVIAINKQNKLLFEVIVKDSAFKRKLLLFDESANLLNSEKL